ncbi:MAG TPA: glutathione S-transferase [Pseudorhodoferax sp.]|nr:glutathione S-transferase [Pseudorhodoferax sp.]
MQLVGMLDSPYVRRVAVGLHLLGLPFSSRPISVFRQLDAFRAINPVVKAPTLVTAEGTVLMDSSLILDHAETLAGPARSLWPAAPAERLRALRITGLALAACEKAVQIVYERALRPPEKQHQPWLDRIHAQMLAGFGALEDELRRGPAPAPAGGQPLGQAELTAAVVWHFARQMVPDHLPQAPFPLQRAASERAEGLEAFRAWPHA